MDLSEETDRVLPCSCFTREKKEEAPLDERLPRDRARARCSSGNVDKSPRNSLKSPLGVGSELPMLNVANRILMFGFGSSPEDRRAGPPPFTRGAGEGAVLVEDAAEVALLRDCRAERGWTRLAIFLRKRFGPAS